MRDNFLFFHHTVSYQLIYKSQLHGIFAKNCENKILCESISGKKSRENNQKSKKKGFWVVHNYFVILWISCDKKPVRIDMYYCTMFIVQFPFSVQNNAVWAKITIRLFKIIKKWAKKISFQSSIIAYFAIIEIIELIEIFEHFWKIIDNRTYYNRNRIGNSTWRQQKTF